MQDEKRIMLKDPVAFGRAVKAFREVNGLSQKALGLLCHPRLVKAAISDVENGKAASTRTIGALIQACQLVRSEHVVDDTVQHEPTLSEVESGDGPLVRLARHVESLFSPAMQKQIYAEWRDTCISMLTTKIADL